MKTAASRNRGDFGTTMTSSHTNQVHLCSSSSCLSDKNHGRSKSQMCLKKIVDFISFHSSSKTQETMIESGEETKLGGVGVDLNLSLGGGLCFEDLEFGKDSFSACSGVAVGEDVDGSSEVFGDYVSTVDKSRRDQKVNETREDSSGITELQARSSEIEEEDAPSKINPGKRKQQVQVVEEKNKSFARTDKGFLDLLVEAARVVSGGGFGADNDNNNNNVDADDIKEERKTPSQTNRSDGNETRNVTTKSAPPDSKRNEKWMFLNCYEDYEVDISPIVRSKRGRNQVLPCRYRDSVLDPFNTATKQRSTRVSGKRSSSSRK